MAISDYKITAEDIAKYGCVSLPDTLAGNAQENKAKFDRLVRECVANAVNAVIDHMVLVENEAQDWADAEALRVRAEATRVAAENLRVQAENNRADAEIARAAAETARALSEHMREQAEAARVKAESARDGAENDRINAEQERVDEEENRNNAELQRVRFENARQNAENERNALKTALVQLGGKLEEAEAKRVQTEAGRVLAETNRVEAETARAEAETARVNAEEQRVDAETARDDAEESRMSAEQERFNEEEYRQTIEKERVRLESGRQYEEDKRVLAETKRVEAETARVEAEKKRAAKDAERDGKISTIANGLQTTQQTVAALADRLDVLDVLFKFPRTGKVYTVKIPKFAANPATVCEKLDDNVGLVCEPSTDTVEGQDDYADIPLFRWYNCNYLRDSKGHAYPTAIEGISEDYATTGNVDVGVIQMAPYIKWEDADDYNILSITDTPREGYRLWCEAASDGKDYPYVIHSKYFSGIAEDGLPRSQPNLTPDRLNSYLNMIDKYFKKGDGYFGAREARNTWQIIFTLIKYSAKSSQTVFAGCTNYNRQYSASIQRDDKLTYFPLTKAQADGILVGSRVSVGYGSNNNGAINNDRGISTIHKYADAVRVLRIEALDDANSAVYLDIEDGFNTVPIALTDTLSAPIMLSTMPWHSGSTDAVIGHHDGSPTSNTNGLYPYRVQGVEYAVGGYFVASDVVMDIQSDCSKNVLVAPPEVKRLTDAAQAVQNYRLISNIPGNAGADYWIGDFALDLDSGVSYPSTIGSGDRTGTGDRAWIGGTSTAGQREYLRGGNLWDGSDAGSSFLACWSRLDRVNWYCLAAD